MAKKVITASIIGLLLFGLIFTIFLYTNSPFSPSPSPTPAPLLSINPNPLDLTTGSLTSQLQPQYLNYLKNSNTTFQLHLSKLTDSPADYPIRSVYEESEYGYGFSFAPSTITLNFGFSQELADSHQIIPILKPLIYALIAQKTDHRLESGSSFDPEIMSQHNQYYNLLQDSP